MKRLQNEKPDARLDFVFDIVNITMMLIIVLICIYPFYYMLCYAFSNPSDAFRGITVYPRGFTIENISKVMLIDAIPRATLLSLTRTIIGSLITLVCCSFFAYLVSKPQMYGRRFIYRFTIITMYVSGGLIPTFLIMQLYGLTNSFLIYILPTAVSAYYVVLFKTFFEQIPGEMEESAVLDGAGYITCWAMIIVPLSKPIIATIAVFAMVGQWNSWFDAHIYITKKELYPLQYILYNYLQEAQRAADEMERMVSAAGTGTSTLTPTTVRMTVTSLITFPILLVYPFMQKYFVEGIMLGAVKG